MTKTGSTVIGIENLLNNQVLLNHHDIHKLKQLGDGRLTIFIKLRQWVALTKLIWEILLLGTSK